jgi:tRNA modification GTPase
MTDTIFALSTPPGRSAVAVIRLSGPNAYDALCACFAPKHGRIAPRMLTYGHVVDGEAFVDEAMAVFLPAPQTYTREDVAEIQCHGSPAVIAMVLRLLTHLRIPLRPAEPGEFTRRAFENGRIDLAKAEAVMALLGAEGEQAARASLRELRGAVSRPVADAAARIVQGLAAIEAGIDFPEDDWEAQANEDGFMRLREAQALTAALCESYQRGRLVREGVRIAIIGRPNVGKSSLLNALAGFERALVSDEAGTTRDVVEHAISVDGIAVRLYDTAGMRAAATPLERRGMALGSAHIDTADIAIFIVDGSEPLDDNDAMASSLLQSLPVVAAINKRDLKQVVTDRDVRRLCPQALRVCSLSAQNGEGVEALLRACLSALPLSSEGSDAITSARHYDALTRARDELDRAISAHANGIPADIAALNARAALSALGEITGETLHDDVIDRIFSTFCVGK